MAELNSTFRFRYAGVQKIKKLPISLANEELFCVLLAKCVLHLHFFTFRIFLPLMLFGSFFDFIECPVVLRYIREA